MGLVFSLNLPPTLPLLFLLLQWCEAPPPASPRHFFLLFFCLGPKIHKQRPSNLFLPKLLSAIWFSEQVTQPAGGKGGNTGGGGEGEWGGRRGGEGERREKPRLTSSAAVKFSGRFLAKQTTTELRRCHFLLWMLRRRREEAFDPEWPPHQPPWWHVLNSCSRFRVSPIERGFVATVVWSVWTSHTAHEHLKKHTKTPCFHYYSFFFFNFHSDGSWPRLSRKWGRLSWTAPFVMNHVHLQILVLQPWTWCQNWKKKISHSFEVGLVGLGLVNGETVNINVENQTYMLLTAHMSLKKSWLESNQNN